jgi:putative acetyltransferase
MYVRPSYRGRGFGKRLLDHLAAYSLQQGVGVLRLETGIYQTEALSLYERYGFQRIGPFGGYREDPLSVFFEKRLHDKIPSEET